ncbi:MAG: ABC transporter substrate-binding protein [Bacteroidota bacterium]
MLSNLFAFSFRNFAVKALIYLTIAFLIIGCSDKTANETVSPIKPGFVGHDSTVKLRQVTFLPYWVTSAQFAGYYVAQETGIYEKYGIKLTIIPYQPFITPQDLINNGKADFTALWLVNAIELKDSGADIVNIAQLSTRSSLMLVAKKKSGISTLKDMNGKRVGIWTGFELQPKAFFKKYRLDVKIVPIGSTNNLFLMDGVDITNANWFDEYHSIINSGFDPDELSTFFFADYGFNFLEDGIYCLSDKLKKEPGLCSDFVKATLEGWKYAFENPEKAIDIVVKYAKNTNQPVNRVHQRWMLDRYKDLYIRKGETAINTTLPVNDYQFVGKALTESGLIKTIPSFGHFYHPVIKH